MVLSFEFCKHARILYFIANYYNKVGKYTYFPVCIQFFFVKSGMYPAILLPSQSGMYPAILLKSQFGMYPAILNIKVP